MKKTLIAMAILASSGAAMAQSNVSLYGIVDLGFNSSNKTVSGDRQTGIDSGLQSGSRFGLKGTEDLGNGLKANFVLEQGFNADNGSESFAGSAFGRQAWLGLSGGFGEVRLGRQYSPMRDALEAIDPFRLGLAGAADNVWSDGLVVQRLNDSISYATPSFSGFNAVAAYSFGEQEGSTSNGAVWSLGAGYDQGPLSLKAVYQNANLDTVGVNNGDIKEYLLAGTYDFGVAKAHAAFGERKYEVAPGNMKTRNYMVGVSAPVGAAGSVMASYIVNENRTFNDADSKQFALGYQYDLSKRTNVYASYAYNKQEANIVLPSFGRESANTYNVGLRHKF